MKKYIALLRGINVGGKNKISMAELKRGFEELGFLDVVTYINSGNVIFNSDIQANHELSQAIESMIVDKFKINTPVAIVEVTELSAVYKNAPIWWNTSDKEIYDNAIFVIYPTSVEDVYKAVGEAIPEYEKTAHYNNVIFWSFQLKTYSKARWSKIVSSKVNNSVTIRTANTVRKLLEIANKK